jgi:hypothetical protein
MNLTKLNNQVGEQQYRKIKGRMSYSLLKLYATNRTKFYKEVVCGEVTEKDQTLSTIVGDMVHTLLADQGEFDNKYVIAQAMVPNGQMLELCDALYKRTVKSLDSDGVQKEKFEVLFTEAVNSVKYDYNMAEVKFKGKNLEKIVEMFSSADKDGCIPELYYKEKLANTGKTVVTESTIMTAEKVVEQLKTHPYTREIINLKTGNGVEVFNEVVILYEIDGVEYQSMVDKLVIDHNDKMIIPWDYKCTWMVEENWEYNYLKNMYYLQVGIYDEAIQQFIIEHNLEGYKVCPMNYIAADVTGNAAPVIYRLSEQDVEMAKKGFKVRGKQYLGVEELQDQLLWSNTTGNWTTTKSIHEANGVCELGINYEKV